MGSWLEVMKWMMRPKARVRLSIGLGSSAVWEVVVARRYKAVKVPLGSEEGHTSH